MRNYVARISSFHLWDEDGYFSGGYPQIASSGKQHCLGG